MDQLGNPQSPPGNRRVLANQGSTDTGAAPPATVQAGAAAGATVQDVQMQPTVVTSLASEQPLASSTEPGQQASHRQRLDPALYAPQTGPPPPPALSYEAELEQLNQDLEDEEALVNQEISVIEQMKADAQRQFTLLEDRQGAHLETLKLLQRKRNQLQKSHRYNENALNLESFHRLNELQTGELRDKGPADLADIIAREVRKELSNQAIKQKARREQPPKADVKTLNKESTSFGPRPNAPDISNETEYFSAKDNLETTQMSPENSLAPSSVYDSPYSFWSHKLTRLKSFSEGVIKNNSSHEKVLELTSNKITDTIENFESVVMKLQLAPAEKEEFQALTEELELSNVKIVELMSKIISDHREKQFAPKAGFPQFNGNALEYLSFQSEIDEAMKHLSDRNKMSTYRKAIIGSQKTEILEHISNVESYEAMYKAMFSKFGDYASLLPAELDKVRNLPQVGDKAFKDENSNIGHVLAFMRWLIFHKKKQVFSQDLMISVRSKLRFTNQERMYEKEIMDFDDLKTFLEKIQSHNFQRLNFAPPKPVKDVKPQQNQVTSGIRSATVSKVGNPTCLLCNTGHFTSDCGTMKAATSNEQVLQVLNKSNICPICIVHNNAAHKGKCKTEYFNKRLRCNVSKLCQCGSGLNSRVCRCPRIQSNATPASAVATPNVTPTAPTTSAPTSGARVAQSVPGPSTAVRYASITINGTMLGQSSCASQVLKLLAPNGTICYVLVLWDDGAENTIISKSLKDFFWSTQPATYTFNQCTTRESITGEVATIQVVQPNGNLNIQGLTQDLSMSYVSSKNISIPEIWQQKYNLSHVAQNPGGVYAIIFGRDLNRIRPIEIERHDNLSLYKSCIDDAILVAGSNNANPIPTTNVMSARFSPADQEWLNKMSPPDFSTLPRMCSDCKGHKCNECNATLLKSPKVRWEEEVLTSCLTLVPEPKVEGAEGYWLVSGKYNANLAKVPPLRDETFRFQKRLENGKLLSNPDLNDEFNKAMFKRIDNGNFAFLKDVIKQNPEFLEYQQVYSPVNYSLKETSLTTKLRPVINSSFAPNKAFPSLNECQFVGSSLNHNIQDIILKMRTYKHIGTSDINNFYQSLILSPKDQALNLMLFREQGWNMPGEVHTLVSLTLNYGQTHSQFLANKAKLLTSEKYILPISKRCHQMMEFSLTDDIVVGGFTDQEARFLASVAESGLLKTSFTLKPWVFSFQENPELLLGKPDTQGCLGLKWSPGPDTWKIPVNINLAPKKRGARDQEFSISNMETARELFSKHGLTKRTCLRICHSIYDPISLFIQLKVNMNLLYRKLITCMPDLAWEDKVPTHFHKDWLLAIQMANECRDIEVPRFCLTNCKTLAAQLGIFCDGSGEASCARLFLKYKTTDGKWDCNYFTGSTKLAGPGAAVAPKTEAESALIGLRQCDLIHKITDIEITDVFLFSDSTITLGGICGISCTQKLFYSQRNWESQQLIEKYNVQLYHTNSDNQDADIGSKLELNKNFAKEKFYWKSKWFHLDQKDWPVTKYEFQASHVSMIQNPKMTVTVLSMNFTVAVISSLLEKFKSFQKIVKTMTYLFFWLKSVKTYSEGWERGTHFILKLLQVSHSEITGIGRQFIVTKDDEGLWTVVPRNFFVNGKSIQKKLFLISINEKIGTAILNDCHIHCSNVGSEIAKMLSLGFYVTRNRCYFKKLQKTCTLCKRIRKEATSALMGPNHQLQAAKNAPPFAIVFMDVLGYFKVKKSRNVTGKLFILCITCIWTRYSVFIPLEDMKATSVLMAIKQASYQLGGATPSLIYCDSATNFLPIGEVGGEADPSQVNSTKLVSDLRKVLHSSNISLKASCPRSSWRNSIAESMVRCFKLAMKKSGFDHKTFTPAQWQYVSSQMQFLVNSRPLNIKNLHDELIVLTPINLMFGTRQNFFPRSAEVSEQDSRLFSELIALDKKLKTFENAWFTSYANELMKWTKYKTKGKPLQVGDIVYMLDRINPETKQPTLAAITEVFSDRTYSVEYSKKSATLDPKTYEIKKAGKKFTVQRPAQMLCHLTSPMRHTDEISVDPFTVTEGDILEENLNQDDSAAPVQDEILDHDQDEILDQGSNKVRTPLRVQYDPDEDIPTITKF